MIRIKQNGVRAVIHPQTGVVMLCDALTFSLLDALQPPFSEDFPMGLRYSFAKYDSADLKRAYAMVKEIYKAAEEAPASLSVRTSAVVSADRLPDEATLADWEKDCPSGFSCTVIANGDTPLDTLRAFCTTVQKVAPTMRLSLRCPVGFSYTDLPFCCVFIECGDSGNVTEYTPLTDNTVLSCTCDAHFLAEADRIYSLGYKVFSLLPTDKYDIEAFLAEAEKLTREWIRIERNDPTARFFPFTFADVLPGKTAESVDTDTLPGYFQNAGLLSHITPVTKKTAVLAKCVECAVVLQAQKRDNP